MNFDFPVIFSFSWIAVYHTAICIVHLFFALGVLRDAERQLKVMHRGTFIVSGNLWALATLIGGVFVVGIYWAIHHSKLRPTNEPIE